MANEKQLKILRQGVDTWNRWKNKNKKESIDLSYADLTDANLKYANLSQADLSNADLSNANLSNADLSNADFWGVDLDYLTPFANLKYANLSQANLSNADLSGANFNFADLSGANFNFADLTNANFYKADLTDANFYNANLTNTNFNGADLSRADLSSAILYKTIFYNAILSSVIFHKANLTNANLSNTDLTNADLTNANLDKVYLDNADLSGANLSNANLSNANLSNANLSSAKLKNANFQYSNMGGTILGLTDLGLAKGLESVRVGGECIIDFQTLRDSKNIPKNFLLKIGLPENYINYLPDFYDSSPLRLFPVFLSHSWENKDFAGKLYDALIKRGVLVWYDEKKLRAGDKIFEGLTKAIDVYDKMILVCSKESLEESWWVDEEMNRIFKKEERTYLKEKKKNVSLLIPITIDDHIYKWDGAKGESIRDKVIGDFREWEDDDKFEKALDDLISALNVDRERDERKPTSFLDEI